MSITPFVVGFEGTVTSFAANGHFRHRCVIAVGGRVIILMQAGVVTFSTKRIPIHSPP